MNDDTRVIPALDRRQAMAALGLGALAAGCVSAQPSRGGSGQMGGGAGNAALLAGAWDAASGQYTLPSLGYQYDALEPHIDATTMQIHHSKHHAGYVRGLNKALEMLGRVRAGDDSAGSIKHWSRELAFHGSGHLNHVLFWLCMAPKERGGGGEASGTLRDAIDDSFGGYGRFVDHFKAAAGAVEGSGWAWLAYEPLSRRLIVTQAEKHQNLFVNGMHPLLGIDVWEHAYYL
ncbi:MAG: superoxide dismutase, partial [Phycisphaerales bacterium]|nr:superoxide dismutase [Phycisphaerales bacterium]